ncbi:short-chain fatty acid transporter [Mycoplasma sp. P36-A1]|uniref:short-chain fatty acid transporter n=1 Tax=Mycoplasma sp. P36-A1 TaxID=3252900 RepID=UPI003C2E36C4
MKKISKFLVSLVQKYLPDPFVFCILLTIFVYVCSLLTTSNTPISLINHWYTGFWSLLSFAMQMVLVLVTGYAMASAPLFKKALHKIALKIKTPAQAIIVVTLVAMIANVINWGFGLVIGAIFAKEIAKVVKNVDYPLLIASAYSGFLVWHGGLSGSIPLALATGGETLKTATGGVVTAPIPSSETIFSFFNITIIVLLLIAIPLVNMLMHPKKEEAIVVDPKIFIEENQTNKVTEKKFSDKLENSRILSGIIIIAGLVFIVGYFKDSGFLLSLDIVNFIFLIVGLILHKTPINYVRAIQEGISGSAGIVLQFPFYAGIMGIMAGVGVNGDSFGSIISTALVNLTNETTFNVVTFLNAGIVNFFIPSGGGQWAIQGPIILPAAQQLGIDAAHSSMAIAWGDAWTNMIQPFWALPALGIAKLNAKDIMGYCIVDLIVAGVIICGVFLVL